MNHLSLLPAIHGLESLPNRLAVFLSLFWMGNVGVTRHPSAAIISRATRSVLGSRPIGCERDGRGGFVGADVAREMRFVGLTPRRKE